MGVEIVKGILNHARIAESAIMKSNISWKMNGLAVIDVSSEGFHNFSLRNKSSERMINLLNDSKKVLYITMWICKKDLSFIARFFMQIDGRCFWFNSKEYGAMKGRILQ